MMNSNYPAVLCFSGHDPSGGAGIQADIEALASLQCHCCNVVTALTEQDTHNIYRIIPQIPEDIIAQANRLVNDFSIKAIKIGLLGRLETAMAISSWLDQHRDIPVIFDPVLAAGGGKNLASQELKAAIIKHLLPKTMLLTPNSIEARTLAGEQDLQQCGAHLTQLGCDYVLITGTHESSAVVDNTLFHAGRCIETYHWDRLAHDYHGSGCTLASTITGLYARGLDMRHAVQEAQEYTWNSLEDGNKVGSGQFLPNRFFWMTNE